MITVREVRTSEESQDIVLLGQVHLAECLPHLPFDATAVIATADMILSDADRKLNNLWLARQDDEPVGYALGQCCPYYFNYEYLAKLEMWYVIPAARKSWAALKLIKAFEEWGRLNGSRQLYVGVARTDQDEARHIRRLFPRLGYDWCGSNYIKETTQ